MFLDYCYGNLINDSISETIEYYCYHMDSYYKHKIAYYMLATSFIINKLHINQEYIVSMSYNMLNL